MKLKKFWIPSLILGIIGGTAKLCDTLLNSDSQSFFLNSAVCNALYVGSILLLVIIGWIMLFGDRKFSIKAYPSKNTGAALFGFLASFAVLGSGVIALLSLGAKDTLKENMLTAVLGIAGGIVMLYESCISFTGHNGMKKLPVMALALPVWSCGQLVIMFINYSRVSIHATEMYDVISMALLSLFLYYQALFFAEVNPSSAVRRGIVYGCSFVMCGFVTTTDIIIKMFMPKPEESNVDHFIVEPTLSRILLCAAVLSFCVYAVFYMIGTLSHAEITAPENYDIDEDYDYDEYDTDTLSVKTNNDSAVKATGEEKTEEIRTVEKVDKKIIDENAEQAKADKKAIEEQNKRDADERERAEAERKSVMEAERKKLEAEKRAEAERKAAMEAEKKRLEAEKKAEAERKAAIEAERKRLEAEEKAEAERKAAMEAERKRLEAERKAEADRKLAEERTAKTVELNNIQETNEDEDFDNVFMNENGEVDYEEIYKLLDSMSEDVDIDQE